MKRILSLGTFILVATSAAGCAGGASEEEARAVWTNVEGSLAGPNSTGQARQALSLDVSLGSEAACDDGGSVKVDSDIDLSLGGLQANVTFDYLVQYLACAVDGTTLDGDLSYASEVNAGISEDLIGAEVVYTYQGELKAVGERELDCIIDVRGEASAGIRGEPGEELRAGADVVFEGSVCGQDASKIVNVEVSLTK